MMLGTKAPKRSVHKVVEYIQSLSLRRERDYARACYHALMKDQPLPEPPKTMAWRRAVDIKLAVGSRIPDLVDQPRDEMMCMYPSRCDGFCLKQQEDGWACTS